MPTGQSTYFNDLDSYNRYIWFDSGANVFHLFVGQCTWYCWSKAKAKALAYPERNINWSSLPTSNAYDWFSDAQDNGYETGSTPKKDSIAVWGGSRGHVAFVETWDGTTICYSEANIRDAGIDANDNCIRVDSSVWSTIEPIVANVNNILGTSITVYNGGGKDGYFHEKSQSVFEAKQSNFLGYIYLN